ncbi:MULTISPECIES: HAD-IA family hydrolase [unclassified Bradyrhizobium]|uniref:HAD family hydrolase n=1 Tax=unclassified Bradyrhizobium TaxID=2631580 RepID=UPI0028ED24FE|nr:MULTISPECIES: HAD-IA family hydrolase [unclassified Bradyrhizobium]
MIAFDFDGTLVDSRALILECHRSVFTEFNLALPSPQDSLALIGRSLELVLAQLAGPRAPIQEMVRAYGRVLSQLRAEPAFVERPFDGIADLLCDLSCSPRVALGIATGHTSAAVIPALEALGWRQYFGTVQAADMAPSKPHPGMLLQALEATGATTEEAVFIGDTSFDMEMAREAKFGAIGVAWGYHTAERLFAAGAHRVVRSVEELRDILRHGEISRAAFERHTQRR